MAADDGLPLGVPGCLDQYRAGRSCADVHVPAAPEHRGQRTDTRIGPGPPSPVRAEFRRFGRLRRVLRLPARHLVSTDSRGRDVAPAQLPLRPHPAPLLHLPRSHQDRRADPARDIGRGHAAALLRRPGHRHWAHPGALHHQLRHGAADEHPAGPDGGHRHALRRRALLLLLRQSDQSLREVPGAGSDTLKHATGESERRAGRQGLRPSGARDRQVRG